jgi:hypothetical protein
MAATTPYAQLVGTVNIYIAPYGTAEPAVGSTPSGSWAELGCTEEDQTIEETGEITYFYDNCHSGPVKATRGQEDIKVMFRLVDMTLENLARIKASVSAVTTSGTLKRLALKRGATLTEYALLFKGAADSPYGNFPGQTYIPRGIFEGEGERVRGKTTRDAVDVVFTALEDDAQTVGNELGWSTVATS